MFSTSPGPEGTTLKQVIEGREGKKVGKDKKRKIKLEKIQRNYFYISI